jgi:DNA replication protein DnaC
MPATSATSGRPSRPSSPGRDTTSELSYLTRALKARTLREAVPRLAERARAESCTHEEFLAACLQREVAARESHSGQLVSARYERASLVVTGNKEFGRWGEVFGDDTVAVAMIDRIVHHADVIALKRDSYRLKNHDLGQTPTPADDRQ